MKKLTLLLFLVSLIFIGYAKAPEEKTFLILFDKSELKSNKTSTTYIALSLNNLFKTKAYSGNSDAAILIKVPYGNIDSCQLADFLIRVNANQVAPLGEIALQIIDMDETKSTYELLMTSFEDKLNKNKKAKLPI